MESVLKQPGQPNERGVLVMIGGNEDKCGECSILREVARRVGRAPLAIATLASEEPDYQWEKYSSLFKEFGVPETYHLHAETRDDLAGDDNMHVVNVARAFFFTGGDQVRITTKLGGTPAYDKIRNLYRHEGGLIAGTSAGAAAMGQVMLMSPEAEGTAKHKLGRVFIMARGLGFVRDLVIDQHFAQRARIERLLGALAENPGIIGVGIDEDTAVIVEGPSFSVIGSGAVYVADGTHITYTNAGDQGPEGTLCLFDVRLHVLNAGSTFDLPGRKPGRG